jgi:hypothetical protein
MNLAMSSRSSHHTLSFATLAIPVVLLLTVCASAQQTSSNAQGQSATARDSSLAKQLFELQAKVAKLEAALQQDRSKAASSSSIDMSSMKSGKGKADMKMSGMKMKGMKKAGEGSKAMGSMGMMSGKGMGRMVDKKQMMMQSPGMSADKMSNMKMMGMAMMGKMKGMGSMQMPSALPGFAGASHIYHIGATSFFLDHSEHITLTQEQQVKLNQIKEKELLGQATADRWISQAEQELWVLTSSDSPNAVKIEAKIREVEKLNGDKRIAFIRAVGEAARVLTDEQRKALVGTLPAEDTSTDAGSQE